MRDLEKEGKRLLSGEKGSALRAVAASPEAKRLEEKLDPAAVERVVRSGDTKALGALLQQVLATDEGKALAEKLSRL